MIDPAALAWPAPFLARGEDDWVRLAIFGLLFLGWAIKTALENAKARQRRRQQPHPAEPAPGEPTSGPSPGGESPVPEIPPVPSRVPEAPPPPPHPGRPPRARPRPMPSPEDAESVEPAPRPTVAAFPGPRLAAAARAKALPSEEAGAYDHGLGSLAASDAAIAGESKRRRQDVLHRLGGGGEKARAERDLARAGFLWSEIFGLPRSARGPHRPRPR